MRTSRYERELKEFWLCEYALICWAPHLERVPRSLWKQSIIDSAIQFVSPESRRRIERVSNFITLSGVGLGSTLDDWLYESWRPNFPALLFTADLDFYQLAELLLSVRAEVDEYCADSKFGFALQAAPRAARNASRIVQLLLGNGANVNSQGGHFGNALQAASVMGNEPIVRLLIERGADVNAEGG